MISWRRAIRIGLADAPGRRFDSIEHRRGKVATHDREFVQFLSHAEGSAAELETQRLLSVELKYVRQENAEEILTGLTEIRKMLGALLRKLTANL